MNNSAISNTTKDRQVPTLWNKLMLLSEQIMLLGNCVRGDLDDAQLFLFLDMNKHRLGSKVAK